MEQVHELEGKQDLVQQGVPRGGLGQVLFLPSAGQPPCFVVFEGLAIEIVGEVEEPHVLVPYHLEFEHIAYEVRISPDYPD